MTGWYDDAVTQSTRGTVTQKEPKSIDAKLRRIEQLLGERKRDDYESLRDRLTEARELFHDMLAERFTEAFNAHLAAQPQATFREKQALTRDANADLRALGLAIRCPRTGEPADFHADVGHKPAEGRFMVALVSNDRDRKRTVSSQHLFQVELRGNPNRREGGAEYWARRVSEGRPSSRER